MQLSLCLPIRTCVLTLSANVHSWRNSRWAPAQTPSGGVKLGGQSAAAAPADPICAAAAAARLRLPAAPADDAAPPPAQPVDGGGRTDAIRSGPSQVGLGARRDGKPAAAAAAGRGGWACWEGRGGLMQREASEVTCLHWVRPCYDVQIPLRFPRGSGRGMLRERRGGGLPRRGRRPQQSMGK